MYPSAMQWIGFPSTPCVLKSIPPDDYHGTVTEDHSLTFKFHTKKEEEEKYYQGFESEVALWTKKTLKS